MSTTMTRNTTELLDAATDEFNRLVDLAVKSGDATAALKAYAFGSRYKEHGDKAYEVALKLCKDFGSKWSKDDIATAFDVKAAAASVYVALRDHMTGLKDDGTPLSKVASAVWAVHNQKGTGLVALSSAMATKKSLAKEGKEIGYKTLLNESARLVKEAKDADKAPAETKTLDEQVSAVINRLVKASTDLTAFTGAGYVLSDEQKVQLATVKVRLG